MLPIPSHRAHRISHHVPLQSRLAKIRSLTGRLRGAEGKGLQRDVQSVAAIGFVGDRIKRSRRFVGQIRAPQIRALRGLPPQVPRLDNIVTMSPSDFVIAGPSPFTV